MQQVRRRVSAALPMPLKTKIRWVKAKIRQVLGQYVRWVLGQLRRRYIEVDTVFSPPLLTLLRLAASRSHIEEQQLMRRCFPTALTMMLSSLVFQSTGRLKTM